MTREIYVVCALRDSAWIDMAEFNDNDPAFVLADELRATELDTKVVRKWVEDNYINLGEPFFLTEEIEAEMIAAGHADYVFEPPDHVSTMRLTDILAAQHGVDVPTLLVMFPELNL